MLVYYAEIQELASYLFTVISSSEIFRRRFRTNLELWLEDINRKVFSHIIFLILIIPEPGFDYIQPEEPSAF
jgi:hypothetical protein